MILWTVVVTLRHVKWLPDFGNSMCAMPTRTGTNSRANEDKLFIERNNIPVPQFWLQLNYLILVHFRNRLILVQIKKLRTTVIDSVVDWLKKIVNFVCSFTW